VDAAAKVRDLNFKYLAEGITICDPNHAGEGAGKVFQRICDRAI
jgi:hypothetical protein